MGDEIRVVNASQTVRDVLSFSEAELDSLLADLVVELDSAGEYFQQKSPGPLHALKRAILRFSEVARLIRLGALESAQPNAVEIIAARQLLRNRGVTAHGTNATTQPRTRAPKTSNQADEIRPPVRKELWVDTPPKQAAGWSFAAWATAAAAEDRINLENFVVQAPLVGPTTLGAGQPLADTLLTARFTIEALSVGTCIPSLLVETGQVLAAPKKKWVEFWSTQKELLHLPFAVQIVLKPLLRTVMAMMTVGEQSSATRQLFAESRLSKSSYSVRLSGLDGTQIISPKFIAELGRALNNFQAFARSGVATLLVWEAVTSPTLARFRLEESVDHRQAKSQETPAKVECISWPICPDKLCAQAQRVYEGVLVQALKDILAAREESHVKIPAVPLNYINLISNFGGERMIRNLLVDSEESMAEVDRFLAQLQDDQKAKKLQAQLLANSQQKMVQARQYLVIIEEKLGSSRFNKTMEELVANPIKYDIDNPKDVLTALRVAVRTKGKEAMHLVETEYNNRAKVWELELNNKCPHVQLVRTYRATESLAQRDRIMRQIKALLEGKGEGRRNWISCKNCSFRAICPHVIVRHELQQRQADFGEIRSQLRKFASSVRYSDSDITPNYSVFCSLCSEELYIQLNDDFSVEQLGLVGSMEGDLKRFLWKSMMQILSSAKAQDALVTFNRPVDTSRFSAEAVDICHPLVVTGKFQGRSRSMTKEQRERWQHLSGLVYLYAFLFAVALKVSPRGEKTKVTNAVSVVIHAVSGTRRVAARNPDEMAKALLVDLVKKNSLLISQLETVTNEQIGNQFRDAYAHIQNTHGRLQVSAEDTARVFLTDLVELDPFFRLLKNTILGNGFWQIDDQKKAANAFKAIMGRPLEYFLTEGGVNNVPTEFGPFIRTIMSRRGGIEYPAGVPPKWVYDVPTLQLYKNAYKSFASRAGNPKKYWAKVKASEPDKRAIRGGLAEYAGVGRKPAEKRNVGYVDGLNLVVLYAMVANDEDEREFQEALSLARKRERRILDAMKVASFPPQTNFPEAIVNTYTTLKQAPLSRLYDEEGTTHDWSIYIWKNSEGDEKALTKKEILKTYHEALTTGEPSKLRGYCSDDRQCGTCGVRWSEVDKLDEAKVEKHLKARLKLGGFFMYYESRCPVEGLHEFAPNKDRMLCKKCGVESQLLTVAGRKSRMKEALSFFAKYEETFTRTITPVQPAPSKRQPQNKQLAAKVTTSTAGQFPKRDFDQILGLSAFLGINTAEIEALGSGSGRTHEEVKSGKNIPPMPETLDDPRLLSVDNIFRDMVVRYCNLYFQQKRETDTPPLASPDKLEVNEAYYAPYKGYKNAARIDLAADAYQKSPEALQKRQEEWATALMLFSIESFCQVVLRARDLAGQDGKGLVRDLAKDIIHKESFFTLPGEFQWSLFGDEETRSNSVSDSAHDDPRRYGEPDGAEDVYASLERAYARGDESAENPFSLDSLDIDKATVEANLDN